MMDIVGFQEVNGQLDMVFYDSNVPKAVNVVSTQIGSLSFAPNFGIDLQFFLNETFEIQTEAFKSYCVQRLIESNVDVSSVTEVINDLDTDFDFGIAPTKSTEGFVR